MPNKQACGDSGAVTPPCAKTLKFCRPVVRSVYGGCVSEGLQAKQVESNSEGKNEEASSALGVYRNEKSPALP